MSILEKLSIDNVVSFELYPSAILGPTRIDVVVDSILKASTVRALGFDIDATWTNVYPTIPSTVEDDPNKSLYIRIKVNNDDFEIIALPWIKEDSIVVSNKKNAYITIPNIDQGQSNNILNALVANGFSPSKIEFK